MKKFAVAAGVMFLSFAFVTAEEFTAVITKVEGKKVTFAKLIKGEKGEKGKKGEEQTLTVSDSAKIVKAKFSKGDDGKFKIEAGEALEGGLENKAFKNEKGTTARITTSDDGKSITQIMTFGGGFDKKKKKTDAK